MRVKRFQNKVAESRYTLPFTGAYTILICLVGGMFANGMWVQFALLALSTYLIMELNNVNALIRIYSRMVSCSYLALSVMAFFLLGNISCGALSACMVAFYLFFFSTYQDKGAVGRVFYAFVMLGVASVFFVKILYLLPIFWLLMFTNIMCGSIRTLLSSLFGTILPYWFIGAYYLLGGNISDLYVHFAELAYIEPLSEWQSMEPHRLFTIAFVVILALTGMIHFRLNNYKDKIRTRMLFEIFSVVDICLLIFIVLQPSYCDELLVLLLVNTAPLIGHYIALTNTRITNISFYFILLATFGLTIFNIWMQ